MGDLVDSFGRYRVSARWIVGLGALMVVLGLTPTTGAAQECTDCVVYAATELNLRQDPALEAPVLRLVAEGSPLQRGAEGAGDETNGYVPVTYDGVPLSRRLSRRPPVPTVPTVPMHG